MKPTTVPTLFLVTAMTLSGVTIATAQNAPATAAAQGAEAPVVLAQARGDRDGRGRHGGRGLMRDAFQAADADGDGALTQAELDAWIAGQITTADADADGALTLEEFEPIFNDRQAPRMVDAFQALDADGSGRITAEEVDARFGNLVERMDRNGDGALSRDDRRGTDRR